MATGICAKAAMQSGTSANKTASGMRPQTKGALEMVIESLPVTLTTARTALEIVVDAVKEMVVTEIDAIGTAAIETIEAEIIATETMVPETIERDGTVAHLGEKTE